MREYPECGYINSDSEYAAGPKYATVLNMKKFWMWQGSQYASLTQRSDYVRICLDRVLNIPWLYRIDFFRNLKSDWALVPGPFCFW